MTVNTIVIEVPMLNAAPPLRVSVIVRAPPSSRMFGWSGIVATTMALEMTSAAMTNAATASSSTTRRGRSGGAAFMVRKLICAFRYAGPVEGFEPLPAQVDLPALELQILTRWQDAGIFERSLKQTEDGPSWIFYEGPPTANGMPGAHHVEARTFKDLFPRFKTMQGFHVPRKGGDVPADGLLGRHRARLPDHGRQLHRVGLVVAQGRVRGRAAGPRPPDQPLLPALRHPAVRRRA